VTAPADLGALGALRPLLGEVGDAKRIRVASAPGSLAEQAFGRAWSRLARGDEPEDVALSETAAALVRVRLAGIDASVLADAGLSEAHVPSVLERAFDEVSEPVAPALRKRLRAALTVAPVAPVAPMAPMAPMAQPAPNQVQDQVPALATTLARQPRAGATCPGLPRLIVEPPESHADHCLTVAVYGVLVAPAFGADPVAPFLVGLAHHLHNVRLPDAGFTGEVLLGKHLPRVMARFEDRELDTLPTRLAERLRIVLRLRADAQAPESQAFHAADVLDRVLQVHHHARAAAFTAEQALDDLQLVHAGPVQTFHESVLQAAGL